MTRTYNDIGCGILSSFLKKATKEVVCIRISFFEMRIMLTLTRTYTGVMELGVDFGHRFGRGQQKR